MRVVRHYASLAPFVLALLTYGCVASSIVQWESRREAGWRRAARARGLGAWATFRFDSTSRRSDVSGELIAVGEDSLLLLNSGALLAVPTPAIGSAVIEIREDIGPHHPLRPLRLVHPSAKQWKPLARFARFPQGLPAGADSSIRSAAQAPAGADSLDGH